MSWCEARGMLAPGCRLHWGHPARSTGLPPGGGLCENSARFQPEINGAEDPEAMRVTCSCRSLLVSARASSWLWCLATRPAKATV